MRGVLVAVIVLILIVVIGISWYIRGVDRVVQMHESINAAWSQVENVLQRRADLIPNLVNTVKGFAAQEEKVFTEVTRLRSQWGEAGSRSEQIEAANQMTGALGRLLLVAERYPDLKSNQNFLELQSQLEGTENRIAVERRRYNETVREFNSYIRTFFGRFFAARRGLTEPEPYFEAEEGAAEVPQVEF